MNKKKIVIIIYTELLIKLNYPGSIWITLVKKKILVFLLVMLYYLEKLWYMRFIMYLFLCGTDLRWYFGCLGKTKVVGLLKRAVVLTLRLRCKCLPFCTCFLAIYRQQTTHELIHFHGYSLRKKTTTKRYLSKLNQFLVLA
jgi:hypothetical protein